MSAFEDALYRQLVVHEGLRLKPYRDSVGKLTIGVGRNLDDVGIAAAEARTLCLNDVAAAESALDARWPWWRGVDDARRAVLVARRWRTCRRAASARPRRRCCAPPGRRRSAAAPRRSHA